jgi:DNA polymerase-3 subunit alpha
MTLFIEIESIEEMVEVSDVYDIEVESDHNFFANGMLVHNCLAGPGSFCVLQNFHLGEEAIFQSLDREFKPLLDVFGKERANIEIQFNKLPEQRIVNKFLMEYSKQTGYPLLATADSHYANPSQWRDREIYKMMAQQTKGFDVGPEDIPKSIDELKCELYPKNGDQMFDTYLDMYADEDCEETDKLVLEAIQRSYKIAHEQIEEVDPDTKMKLPRAFLKGLEPNQKLREFCIAALEELADKWTDEEFEEKFETYRTRLQMELDVITKKDFSLYFLALKEAMDKIKESLLVGAGRGSGAGSLVVFLLGITLIDPIEHELLFERFLSENRNEPPDIDCDVEDRDATLDILRSHFGENNVIAISNFNSLQLKSLVKDISKLYQIPFEEVNLVTSTMEEEARQPILDSVGNDQKFYVFDFDGAYKYSPTFKNFIDKYPNVAESIKVLFKQLKAIGRHAGGVVITEDAESNMPIIRIRGVDQTPWGEGLTAKHLEPFGFIKYDFLGLSTLRVVRKCIERVLLKDGIDSTPQNVNKFYDENLHPNVLKQGKKEVFKSIYHEGRFCGTFQFAERNAQDFCKNAKPLSIKDIAAITSIYRPGPLKANADKKYVFLNDHPEEIQYDHPILEEVLGKSKGLLIYQEQFMLLANKLAGFTLVESDELRKLLVKPVTSLGEEMKVKRLLAGERFVAGCVKNGIEPERAKKLWEEEILGFISYGFNIAHAIAYAYLSYQCAHLFYHYPEEWICSYLENDPNTNAATAETESVGYKIGTLDILTSGKDYSIVDNIVYPPFSLVKGFGDVAATELIEKRQLWEKTEDGMKNFETFFWDITQTPMKGGKFKTKREWKFSKFNKRALDGLIRLEALNGLQLFPEPFRNHAHMRRALIDNWTHKDKQKFNLQEAAESCSQADFTDSDRVQAQSELLGIYNKDLLIWPELIDYLRENDILPLSDLSESKNKIWFILKEVSKATTASGKPYFKLTICDLHGQDLKFNYFFFEPRGGWKVNSIYWAELFKKEGWINVSKGNFIHAISVDD